MTSSVTIVLSLRLFRLFATGLGEAEELPACDESSTRSITAFIILVTAGLIDNFLLLYSDNGVTYANVHMVNVKKSQK